MAHALVRAGSRLFSTPRLARSGDAARKRAPRLQRSYGDGIRLYTGWSIRGSKKRSQTELVCGKLRKEERWVKTKNSQ